MGKRQNGRWHLPTMLCVAFLLSVSWVRETFPKYRGVTRLCFSGQQFALPQRLDETAVKATGRLEGEVGEQVWWMKMNTYQQQVWALSNALAGLLRDSEASKFPPSLRAKTMELQQSCNGLQQFIATSTTRIQKDVRDCVEDLQDLIPSSQKPARLCRKLTSVEDYLTSIRQLLQTQESRAQDLEFDIQSLEDDFSSLQRDAAETSKGYELGVKIFGVCAVVALAAVALPAIAGTAAVAEGAALTAGGAMAAEGAAVAGGSAAIAEGRGSHGGALRDADGSEGFMVGDEGFMVSGLPGSAAAIGVGTSRICLEHATDALKDDDLDDATKICGRLAERLEELV
eukprot:Skav233760  [mRNA]  locus=scaffold2701:52828:54988:+ [translate_table: standard]